MLSRKYTGNPDDLKALVPEVERIAELWKSKHPKYRHVIRHSNDKLYLVVIDGGSFEDNYQKEKEKEKEIKAEKDKITQLEEEEKIVQDLINGGP